MKIKLTSFKEDNSYEVVHTFEEDRGYVVEIRKSDEGYYFAVTNHESGIFVSPYYRDSVGYAKSEYFDWR